MSEVTKKSDNSSSQMRLLGGTPHFVVGSITLKSSLMDPVNGKWKIEFLALSPMSKYGLPRLATAIHQLMPTSTSTLFMVCYVYRRFYC